MASLSTTTLKTPRGSLNNFGHRVGLSRSLSTVARVNNQRSHIDDELVRLQDSIAASNAATLTARRSHYQQQQEHHVFHSPAHQHHQHHAAPTPVAVTQGLLLAQAYESPDDLAHAVTQGLLLLGSVQIRVKDSPEQLDCFLRGLSLAAAAIDRTYGVTLMFETFEDPTSATADARASSHHHHHHGGRGSGGRHSPAEGHNHHHHHHHIAGGRGTAAPEPPPMRDYIAVIQLAQKSEQATELVLRYEPIRAGTHSDAASLSEQMWGALVSQGATWMRCTWGVGGRTTKMPAVLGALCKAARHVRSRLGMAIKVVPRMVHDKSGTGAVVYLSLFNYPL